MGSQDQSFPRVPQGTGKRWQEQGRDEDTGKKLRCWERRVGSERATQTRGETAQAEGLGTKLEGLRALG